jgi:hypothetical protein
MGERDRLVGAGLVIGWGRGLVADRKIQKTRAPQSRPPLRDE